jgi:hypothetical protein
MICGCNRTWLGKSLRIIPTPLLTTPKDNTLLALSTLKQIESFWSIFKRGVTGIPQDERQIYVALYRGISVPI